jgi:hypothetical protein
LIYQRGSIIHASRIQHYSDLVHNEYERLETLDGKPREVLRQNDVVHSLIPEAKLVVVEKQEAKDRFPALLATNKSDVLDLYDMHKLPAERVAGVECEVFSLDPHDTARYAVRLWADKNSGLLMRAQTIGEGGTRAGRILAGRYRRAFGQAAHPQCDQGRELLESLRGYLSACQHRRRRLVDQHADQGLSEDPGSTPPTGRVACPDRGQQGRAGLRSIAGRLQ